MEEVTGVKEATGMEDGQTRKRRQVQMEEVTDMEEGQALMGAMHDGSGDRHGRGPGIDEGHA